MHTTEKQRYRNRAGSLHRRAMGYSKCTGMADLLGVAGLVPVGAQEIPMLVEYLPVTAQSYRVLPGTQAYALDDISRDPGEDR